MKQARAARAHVRNYQAITHMQTHTGTRRRGRFDLVRKRQGTMPRTPSQHSHNTHAASSAA